MKFAFTTCVLLGRSVIEKIYEMNGKLEFLESEFKISREELT